MPGSPERKRALNARAYAAHRQERIDAARAWQVANRERYAAYQAAYHVAHREARLAAMQARDKRVRAAVRVTAVVTGGDDGLCRAD